MASEVKKRKLNYIFHNPNTAEATADYVLKIMIEANMGKVERAMRVASEQYKEENLIEKNIACM